MKNDKVRIANMNLWDAYIAGKELYESRVQKEYEQSELSYMFEECFDCDKHLLILNKEKPAPEEGVKKLFSMIERRASGEPLQYILGKWYFMGLEFKVGKGVLIPRDDTEVLVRESINYLRNVDNAKIIDLCSGSGAIAVCMGQNLKNVEITAVELSDEAYGYLTENIENNGSKVKAVKDDVAVACERFENNYFDAVLSNPPYIPSKDINYLQAEVQKEPRMALDGGEDGLYFYRIICEKWSKKIKRGGILAVEIGIGQGKDVKQIFEHNGFKNITIYKDINNIDRVVVGEKI